MRRIETQEEKERREKRKRTILAIFIVTIMVASVAGYALWGREDSQGGVLKVKIDGRDFFYNGDYWIMKYGNENKYFNYLPNETKDVEVDSLSGFDYYGKKLYIVNLNQAANFIVLNLGNSLERYQEACVEGEECNEEKNLPLKNCSDFVIVFKDGKETKVKRLDNCIYLEGNWGKAADAFVYKLLKIN